MSVRIQESKVCSDAVAPEVGRTLRCVIVTAVFPPEFGFSGRICEQIASELAATRCDVTVLAPFPNRPAGTLFPGYQRSLYVKKRMPAGYELVHCFSTLSPHSRIVPRLLENLSFGITSSLRLLLTPRPDVIFSNSWPIFASATMAAVAKLRRIPFVVSIQDVYPESLVVQSRLSRQSRAVRFMRRIDQWVARQAAGLIVIGEGFRRLYREDRGIEASRLHLVYNWGEPSTQQFDLQASAEFRRQKSIPPDAFVAVYGGNIGPASGTEGVIEAFAQLRDIPVYLVIAGAGSRLEVCRRRARELNCERVIFHTPWHQEETATVLGAADVVLLPTIGIQSLVSIPSKLISYFLMERPVVAQIHTDSETATMMKEADAGWILPPEDPVQLAALLRELVVMDKGVLLEKGRNGRCFAMKNLCRESNLPKVLQILRSVAQRESSCGPKC